MTSLSKHSRRDFIKLIGYGGVTLAVSHRAALATAGLRTGRMIDPGKKMNIACVGVGGKGQSDVASLSGQNIVALCDVDLNKARGSFSKFPDAEKYKDYRKMLVDMDDKIDAVTVSTPDHMHFPVAMMAIQMGKHVFVQKPLAHTIEEARLITAAARKHKVATHMGIQGHSMDGIRRMREWMSVKAIGDIKKIEIWTNRPIWPQGITKPLPAQPVPETLDWNLWQGVASTRDYNEGYMPFKWRGWWDYGCGALGDIGCHAMDCAFDVAGLTNPSSIEAVTSDANDQTAPNWSILNYEFPATKKRPALKLVWHDGDKKPERPKELEEGRNIPGGIGGQLWHGTKGTIMVSDVYCRSARIIPEIKMKEFLMSGVEIKKEEKSIGHYEEWVNACKGGAPAGANFDYAGPLTEMVLLGNLAVRSGKRIEWDNKNMKCTNVPEANKYVRKSYRVF